LQRTKVLESPAAFATADGGCHGLPGPAQLESPRAGGSGQAEREIDDERGLAKALWECMGRKVETAVPLDAVTLRSANPAFPSPATRMPRQATGRGRGCVFGGRAMAGHGLDTELRCSRSNLRSADFTGSI
jgi:hypothetical protein